MKLWKRTALFSIGGCGYVLLELLWRGRSHGSMFLLGGSCFLLLGRLQKALRKTILPLRALAGAGLVTGMELLTGLLLNRDYRIWDYRQCRLNFRGQICLLYSTLWMPVSLVGMALYRWGERLLNPPGFSDAAG